MIFTTRMKHSKKPAKLDTDTKRRQTTPKWQNLNVKNATFYDTNATFMLILCYFLVEMLLNCYLNVKNTTFYVKNATLMLIIVKYATF